MTGGQRHQRARGQDRSSPLAVARDRGRMAIVTTKDVRVQLGQFPLRQLQLDNSSFEGFEPTLKPSAKCDDCGKWICANEPVTCANSLGRKRAHDDDVGCLLQRCCDATVASSPPGPAVGTQPCASTELPCRVPC